MIEFKSKEKYFFGGENESVRTYWTDRRYSDYIEWSLHGHEFFELEIFTEGTGYQILNGKKYAIECGTVHLITTSDFHEMVWENNVEQLGVRFDRSLIDKKLVEIIFSLDHAMVCKLDGEEYRLVLAMITEIYNCEHSEFFPLREQFMKNMLESVIILLLGKFIACEKDKVAGRNHVQQAIAYLEMNFKNDPGLEEVATYVGLNKNYFSTLFSKETGKSFVKYVIDLKLEYSKNLICASDMTMREVCFNSGFKSFSNFAREFKKKFNKTPLQYRKNK